MLNILFLSPLYIKMTQPSNRATIHACLLMKSQNTNAEVTNLGSRQLTLNNATVVVIGVDCFRLFESSAVATDALSGALCVRRIPTVSHVRYVGTCRRQLRIENSDACKHAAR